MTRRQARYSTRSGREGGLDERWHVFVAFWFLAGLSLLTIGVGMWADVAHSHRVAALILLLGILCLAVGLIVRRAERREG